MSLMHSIAHQPASLLELARDALTYPIRGSGKWILLTCAVLSIIADIVMFAPMLGFFAWVLICAYFCAIYVDLIQSTANGEKDAPHFPETSNLMTDVIWPYMQVIFIFLISFSPLILCPLLIGTPNTLVLIALSALGCAYFPMGMLAVVMCGTLWAANPIRVIPSIFRVGGLYLLAVLLLIGLYFAEVQLLEMQGGGMIKNTLIMALTGPYVFMANARILGIIWRERREDLGWF